jgi:prophage DNA circulation protein
MAEIGTLLSVIATLVTLVAALFRVGAMTGEWKIRFEAIDEKFTAKFDHIAESLATISGAHHQLVNRVGGLETDVAGIKATISTARQ